MNISTVMSARKQAQSTLKKELNILQKYKTLGLIKLEENLQSELLEGLANLDMAFIVVGGEDKKITNNVVMVKDFSSSNIGALDFLVTCDKIDNLNSYLAKGVVPIIDSNNHMSVILKEFNAIKNEGNAFIINNMNVWSVFHCIIKYAENLKFPFDNKNLIKNVLSV